MVNMDLIDFHICMAVCIFKSFDVILPHQKKLIHTIMIVSMHFVVCKIKRVFAINISRDLLFIYMHKKVQYINKALLFYVKRTKQCLWIQNRSNKITLNP